MNILEAILPELENARKRDNLDIIYFMLTNILKESSDIVFSGSGAEMIIEAGFNATSKDHKSIRLNGVVSRKKQMLPTVLNCLNQINV